MKNRLIAVFIFLILGLIISIVVIDYFSNRIDNLPKNEFELDIDSINSIGKFTVDYNEVKQIAINDEDPRSIAAKNGLIYFAFGNKLQVITENGKLISSFNIDTALNSMSISQNKNIFLAYKNYFLILDSLGNEKSRSSIDDSKSVYTSIAIKDSLILVADAGNRRVKVFNLDGEFLWNFKGFYNSSNDRLGFIVPSAYFDLAVNKENELWVVNPGIHALQNYNVKGDLINFWAKETNSIEGFIGCCNPSHIAIFDDGRFVTSEKGIVRIKVYSYGGDLLSIVTESDSYKNGRAPEIAVDGESIIALDYIKKMIRIYKLKDNG